MRYLQLSKYLSLPQKDKVIAEYVWIDGSNGLRSKSKVSTFPNNPSNCTIEDAVFVSMVG